jgi:hypothetical protein
MSSTGYPMIPYTPQPSVEPYFYYLANKKGKILFATPYFLYSSFGRNTLESENGWMGMDGRRYYKD